MKGLTGSRLHPKDSRNELVSVVCDRCCYVASVHQSIVEFSLFGLQKSSASSVVAVGSLETAFGRLQAWLAVAPGALAVRCRFLFLSLWIHVL